METDKLDCMESANLNGSFRRKSTKNHERRDFLSPLTGSHFCCGTTFCTIVVKQFIHRKVIILKVSVSCCKFKLCNYLGQSQETKSIARANHITKRIQAACAQHGKSGAAIRVCFFLNWRERGVRFLSCSPFYATRGFTRIM